jgi:OOP family OmpA-OmpF porin
MKKNFLLFVAITSFVAYSQDKSSKDYNVFSVEANVGINKPGENFSPGYFTADPKVYFNFNRVNHFNLGFRYMLNEKFGLKLDGAYDIISPEKGNGSLDFESKQIRVGLQGVVNLRNLLNFDSWTKKFGLLAHAGIQVSLFEPVSKTMPWGAKKEFKDLNEDNGGFIFGLTPQFKLHRRIVLTGDVTFIHNTRHHLTWDGEYSGDLSTTNLKSSMVNTSLGITYYFGKQDEHADFYIAEEVAKTSPDIENLKKKLEDLNKKVDNIKIPTVPSIDEINTMIDGKIKSIPAPARIEDTETINQINEGFINVYFDFNKYTPHPSSTENISRVINFLKNNPEKSMELTGWADIIGSAASNAKLSERRAETVRQVLIKQGGIDPNRLKVVAKGVDNSASKDNEFGRAMVRRVTFTIVN